MSPTGLFIAKSERSQNNKMDKCTKRPLVSQQRASSDNRLFNHRLLNVDNDAAAPDRLSGIAVVSSAQLVVVDHLVCRYVPDLDPELIGITVMLKLAVNGGQHEAIVVGAIDGAPALELGLGSSWNGIPFG